MASQSPKWGRRAAAVGWRAEVVRRLLLVPLALILVSFAISGGKGDVILAIGVVSLLAGAIMYLLMTTSMFRIASEDLGISVGWRSSPPSSTSDYERWCHEQGIRPYAADRSE
jgi:hypothetical protein